MKRRYQALALVITSYIPVEVVSRVVTANAYANLYSPDADSISIPIFGAAFNAFAILCVAMLGLAMPIRGWWLYVRLIPISLAALWSISPILYWLTPNHYWISTSYLLQLVATCNVIYWSTGTPLSQGTPGARSSYSERIS
jgi:hypothetical protein